MDDYSHDENQIKAINSQVMLLQGRGADDNAILDVLLEFIPNVKCFIDNNETSDIEDCLRSNPGVSYFVSLVNLLSEQAVDA